MRIAFPTAKSRGIFQASVAAAGALTLTACVTASSMSPLGYAAYEGDSATVDSLLAQGADPTELGPNGRDAVEMALLKQHPEMGTRMVRKCLEPGRHCVRGLQDAAMMGDVEASKTFAKGGADFDAAINDLKTRSAPYASIRRMSSGGIEGAVINQLKTLVAGYDRGLALLTQLKAERAERLAQPAEAQAAPSDGQQNQWWK